MNNVHILTEKEIWGDLEQFFCGLLNETKNTIIKRVRYAYFHRNKFVATGETLKNTDGIRAVIDGVGNPIIIYDMVSQEISQYCDVCRYRFHEIGGMIISLQDFEESTGRNFYPEIINEFDKRANDDNNS